MSPWWVPDESSRQALTEELLAEVAQGHPLFGRAVQVMSRCGACDEVLIQIGEGDFGMVHLTWSTKSDRPPWPKYTHTGGYLATELAQTRHSQDHGE